MGQSRHDSMWIVLKKTLESEAKFLQAGPYTLEKVMGLIQAGEITYSDFIWTDGWTKWERIGDRPEFQMKKKEEILKLSPSPNFELPSAEEMLKEILVQSRVDWKEILPNEEETAMDVELHSNQEPTAKAVELHSSQEPTVVEFRLDEHPTAKTGTMATGFLSGRTVRLWTLVMVVVLIFGLSLGILFWQHSVQDGKFKESLQKESVKVDTKIRSTAPPQKVYVSQVPATAIVIEQVKKTQGGLFLILQTNGFKGEEIYLTFQGVTGKILKYKSYYGEFKVRSNGSGSLEIELSQYGLGEGEYVVEAKTSRVSDRRTLFVGSRRDHKFNQLLSEFRKKISFFQQREKSDLYRLIHQLESHSVELALNARNYRKELIRSWSLFYLRWRVSVKRISHENFNVIRKSRYKNYAFPHKWVELHQLRERLLDLSSKFHATAVKKVHPAQKSELVKLSEEIRKLVVDARLRKNHIVHLSGWR